MKFHLGYILGLFAIALAGAAGYISVVGWGKLFAGEATIVMIVMGIIEAAKIVTTIYLHRYNKRTPREEGTNIFTHSLKRLVSLKTYLIIGVMSTMFLTSVGIYGFLTGAYQDTANKMELHDGGVNILEGKRDIFQIKIDDNKGVIDTKTKRITILSDLRTQQELRLDLQLSKKQFTSAKNTQKQIDAANVEIQQLTQDIDGIVKNNSIYQDSVSSYQVKIIELKGSSDIASEIGPLKYISSLTGRPMDSIINWIVLLIIFIFDPMAISLLLASNKVFDENSKNSDNSDDNIEPPTTPVEPIIPVEPTTTPVEPTTTPVEPSVEVSNDGEFEDIKIYIADKSPSDDNLNMVIDEVEESFSEPEPSGTTNEVIDEEDLPNEVISEVDLSNESYDNNLSDVIEKLKDRVLFQEKVVRANEVLMNTKLPEEQIEENKQRIKSGNDFINTIKKNTKQSPVITTGNVKREEIKEIKEGTRGYSVDVPEPKKVGTNKEIRDNEPNTFYFHRPKI